MLNEQNRTTPFPSFVEINNPNGELFPNGSLMSWKHRAKEREYLRQLHSSLLEEGKSLKGSYVAGSEILELENEFHALIKSRLEEFGLSLPEVLPHLEGLKATKQKPAWFNVDGMYGGFSYYIKRSKGHVNLVVESWSRVAEGSGQRHLITRNSTELIEEGFV